MLELGYSEFGGTYAHKDNPYTIEFPPGPLAVGRHLITKHATIRRGDELLHILSRTDCIRDRLASFYFFADRSALAAAVAVAQTGAVDLHAIERWSVEEGEANRYREFRERLD